MWLFALDRQAVKAFIVESRHFGEVKDVVEECGSWRKGI
jgi:hypothetical protein